MTVAVFCSTCGAALVRDARFCATCGAPTGTTATPSTPLPVPDVPVELERYEYTNKHSRDADIATMGRQGWQVKEMTQQGRSWLVTFHRPDPTKPQLATTTAINRTYIDPTMRDRDIALMSRYQWQVQGMQTIPGGYNGGKGCVLAVIFLPLALLAGTKPDRYIVTYITTSPLGQAVLPPYNV